MVVHVHGAIWKERGLLTSGNKDIKHEKKFFLIARGNEYTEPDCHNALLRTPETQSDTQTSQINQTAKKTARQATRGPPLLGALIPHLNLSEIKPHYTEQDEGQGCEWGFSNIDPNSIWKINPHGMILFPLKL